MKCDARVQFVGGVFALAVCAVTGGLAYYATLHDDDKAYIALIFTAWAIIMMVLGVVFGLALGSAKHHQERKDTQKVTEPIARTFRPVGLPSNPRQTAPSSSRATVNDSFVGPYICNSDDISFEDEHTADDSEYVHVQRLLPGQSARYAMTSYVRKSQLTPHELRQLEEDTDVPAGVAKVLYCHANWGLTQASSQDSFAGSISSDGTLVDEVQPQTLTPLAEDSKVDTYIAFNAAAGKASIVLGMAQSKRETEVTAVADVHEVNSSNVENVVSGEDEGKDSSQFDENKAKKGNTVDDQKAREGAEVDEKKAREEAETDVEETKMTYILGASRLRRYFSTTATDMHTAKASELIELNAISRRAGDM